MLSKRPGHRQNDLPFQSGPLQLSVFRESPPAIAKRFDSAPECDDVFEPFVKRRPLSESFVFTRDIAALEFSSSSDDEVTDPVPETPLDLSDTENMAAGQDSPSFFIRRRPKLLVSSSTNEDGRPKSLCDTSRPRPPPKIKASKSDKLTLSSVSDKFSRLMRFRSGRSDASKHGNSHKHTLKGSGDPGSSNVERTKVEGQIEPTKLQPHLPTPSSTHPAPVPRKKRFAPKPPPDVIPLHDSNIEVENSERKTAKANEGSPFTNQIPKTSEGKRNGSKTCEGTQDSAKTFDATRDDANTSNAAQNDAKTSETTRDDAKTPEATLDDAKGYKTQSTQNSTTSESRREGPIASEPARNSAITSKPTRNDAKPAEIQALQVSSPKPSESSQRTDSRHSPSGNSSRKYSETPRHCSNLSQNGNPSVTVQLLTVQSSKSNSVNREHQTITQSQNHPSPTFSQANPKTSENSRSILSTATYTNESDSKNNEKGDNIVPRSHGTPPPSLPNPSTSFTSHEIGQVPASAHDVQSPSRITRNPTCDDKIGSQCSYVAFPLAYPVDVCSPDADQTGSASGGGFLLKDEQDDVLRRIEPNQKADEIIRAVISDILTEIETKIPQQGHCKAKKTLNHVTEVPLSGHAETAGKFTQCCDVTKATLSDGVQKMQKTKKHHHRRDVTKAATETDDVFVSEDTGRSKTLTQSKNVDNASSGYSSPGSEDEGAITPGTPLPALTLPSPTSSYYSASLSTSSSRVSDLARELTLPKLSIAEDQVLAEIQTPERIQERPQVAENMSTQTQNGQTEKLDIKPPENADKTELQSGLSPQERENTTGNISPGETLAVSQCVTSQSVDLTSDKVLGFRTLPNLPTTIRPAPRVRPKSEYIPYRSDEWTSESSRVSVCMVEKRNETASLSRAQAKAFKYSQNKGSRKKAAAAAQKSRAFAMRANPQRPSKRHSYAAPSSYIIDESPLPQSLEVPSSNLVSHFVSTQNISTYYDGTSQRTVTPQEILTSKREEFFNAYKYATIGRHPDQIGGSVRHLPVSAREFEFMRTSIREDTETSSSLKYENRKAPKTSETERDGATWENNKENLVQTHPSEASSHDNSLSNSSQIPSTCTGSTWSLSEEMTSHAGSRKPSLRRRIRGAFSFQNIRKAISMEKLSEEEKGRSTSHHYLNENGTHHNGGKHRSATLQRNSSHRETSDLRKAPSISSIVSSVRMRKRRSRMRADAMNRYTIADPENCAKNMDETFAAKRSSTLRPVSTILSNANKVKLEDVGNPSFFRPIGRLLQMNPREGTLLVEMVKPPSGPSGFYIARRKESGDSGSVYISRLSDSYPDKMFAGLMRTGDEITEINGTDVSTLTLDQVYDLILDSEKTLLKLRPSQVHVV